MTPKEKAEELFLKFRHNMLRKQAIDCALICSEELYELAAQLNSVLLINYYTDVIDEIKLL